MYIHKIHNSQLNNNVYTCDKLTLFQRAQSFHMSKTKLLNIRIEPELKKKAKKLAEADGRSLSNWVTKLIASKVESAEDNTAEKKN